MQAGPADTGADWPGRFRWEDGDGDGHSIACVEVSGAGRKGGVRAHHPRGDGHWGCCRPRVPSAAAPMPHPRATGQGSRPKNLRAPPRPHRQGEPTDGCPCAHPPLMGRPLPLNARRLSRPFEVHRLAEGTRASMADAMIPFGVSEAWARGTSAAGESLAVCCSGWGVRHPSQGRCRSLAWSWADEFAPRSLPLGDPFTGPRPSGVGCPCHGPWHQRHRKPNFCACWARVGAVGSSQRWEVNFDVRQGGRESRED